MSFAIHSADGKNIGAGIADYPPPFKYSIPAYIQAIRNALWSIEIGMGGQVDWQASFGTRQANVALTCAAVRGSRFGFKK